MRLQKGSLMIRRKTFFTFLVLLAFHVSVAGISYAVQAAPDVFEIDQPDGHYFEARKKGDEWNNWTETVEGFSVQQGYDGFWYYISRFNKDKPVFSTKRAHQIAPVSLKKHIRPEKEFLRLPPTVSRGIQRERIYSDAEVFGSAARSAPGPLRAGASLNGTILFILAEFNDRSGTYSEASFATFINNNINDYFNKASYGLVTLSQANESYGTSNNGVVGWLNLGYNHPNTGSNTGTANQTLTKNAILAADPYVDFSSYDNNGDSYVDADELAVVVIVAGYEEAYSSPPDPSVWGHRWSLGSVGPPTVDDVTVGDYHGSRGGYAQFGEIHSNHQATMGIMVHELGHLIFGLPDLYDTNGGSAGIGGFGVMGAGSWGKASVDSYSGETPVLPSAWSKYNLSWVDGTEGTGTVSITAAGSASADSVNAAYKLLTNSSGEYFMIENRQPLGYDLGLERWLGTGFGGLAIWHIDENKTNNTEQCAPPSDCSSAHFMVSVEQADANWDLEKNINSGNSTDLWYSGNAASFDDVSTPDSDLYDTTSSDVSVASISASATTMTATFSAPIVTVYSENFESGSLGPEWNSSSTDEGRILVTSNNYPHSGSYHITMDDTTANSVYSLNELTLTLNLTGKTGVMFRFWHMEIGDEDNAMSVSFTGSEDTDGVAISADGNTWYRVVDLGITKSPWVYTMHEVDLDAAIAAAGISYNSTFRIKFQQFDNYPINSDGFAFDDIELTALPSSCTDNDDDGYGNPGDASCENGAATDCDDSDDLEYPNQTWYEDGDGDGYSSGNIVIQCLRPADHYVFSELTSPSGDCDNNDQYIYPGGPAVRISGGTPVYYSSLQNAYNAPGSNKTIQIKSEVLSENITLDQNQTVSLIGGYDCGFTSASGTTTAGGNLTISDGTITIENFIVQ
jgi:M6 family metalloprotease-like protein